MTTWNPITKNSTTFNALTKNSTTFNVIGIATVRIGFLLREDGGHILREMADALLTEGSTDISTPWVALTKN